MGMSPSRECKVGSVKVEEFYWAGRWPVYIDNKLTEETYPQAVERLEREAEQASAEAEREAYEQERHELEEREMEQHFRRQPHG